MTLRLPVVTLILANLVPLVGVLVAGWSSGAILALYWVENVIVGAYTLAKLWTLPARSGPSILARLGGSLFFAIHYGIFMFVHGAFVLFLALPKVHGPDLTRLPSVLGAGAGWAVAGLAVSHGVSFVTNFLVGGERHRLSFPQILVSPYGRLVVLHVAILIGAVGAVALGDPLPALVVLVLLKTGLDLLAHRRTHARAAPGGLRSAAFRSLSSPP